MAKRLIPLFNRILVEKIVPPSKTNLEFFFPRKPPSVWPSFMFSVLWLCIIVPNSLNSGKVVAVGPGIRDRDGKLIPVHVKEGETVLLPEYGGTEVKLGDKGYHLYREDDILGTLHD
ncbi:hypothetical protein FNV43_RR04492 [Rhamnella rubrinervis]|uniref:10 kDa chaperonin n=1 Tax=Rhamnella rubrinervis TaxID=2594499 RepID=A0A8K0HKD1_9ROSA|nr:hypothetical protein FNV43_RR04492 [Rhamnella rubrinervis]